MIEVQDFWLLEVDCNDRVVMDFMLYYTAPPTLNKYIHVSATQTDLSGIVADGERWALVFGRRVSVAILGGEGEIRSGMGVQPSRQPLVQRLLGRPRALALLV